MNQDLADIVLYVCCQGMKTGEVYRHNRLPINARHAKQRMPVRPERLT
jgi:hypothetical protein